MLETTDDKIGQKSSRIKEVSTAQLQRDKVPLVRRRKKEKPKGRDKERVAHVGRQGWQGRPQKKRSVTKVLSRPGEPRKEERIKKTKRREGALKINNNCRPGLTSNQSRRLPGSSHQSARKEWEKMRRDGVNQSDG